MARLGTEIDIVHPYDVVIVIVSNCYKPRIRIKTLARETNNCATVSVSKEKSSQAKSPPLI